MRKIFLLLTGLAAVISLFSQEEVAPGKRLFNADWKFSKGHTEGAEQISFNDAGWRTLDLPHDYSIEGAFSKSLPSCAGYLPGGTGWYRKKFLAASDSSKKVFISFDGVYKNSEVWINGHYLGKHSSGFTAFEYDITEWLQFGKENVIAVKVDREDITDSGWYTGSGIYRNVFLKYTDRVHIGQWGVFAVTPVVSSARASVHIQVDLLNESGSQEDIIVESILLTKEGKKAAGGLMKTSLAAGAGQKAGIDINLENPSLWSVGNPYLYTLRTILRSGEKILDQQVTKIGIRKIVFDSEKGLFVNGQSLKMKGVCMVQDAGAVGAAVPRKVWESRLDLLKQLGCNAIRACHNPHADEFLDVCDEKGFLVIGEAFDEWEAAKTKWIDGWNQTTKVKNGYYKYFPQWGKRDLHDQVLRDRNHPSIIMWSIGNEIDFPNDPYTHPSLDSSSNPQTFARYMPGNPGAERLAVIAKELVAVVKELDTTRPVTAGLASAFMSHQVGFAQQLDVIGYNYQESLFPANHKKYPGKAFYASETGFRLPYWEAVTKNDFVAGQFIWTGFEYLGESFKWPRRTNPFGIIDLGGYFKPEAYFRQSLWSDKPMVYIGAWDTTVTEPTIYFLWDHKNALPHWNWQPKKILRISGFTNCEEIELFLNGRSLGKKWMKDSVSRVLNWYIPFREGTLKAIARIGGKQAAEYTLKTAGEPFRITAKSDEITLKANRNDASRIEVYIRDRRQTPVYLAENLVSVKTTGPVRLLAIENSNPIDTSAYRDTAHTAFRGRMTVYVQSTGKPGRGSVIFSSPGLKPATVELEFKNH